MDRTTYREKTGPAVTARLREEFGNFYLLPEGGSNALAVRGCVELPAEIIEPFDLICCPVGTGGTLAGIAGGLRPGQRAAGFAVLKGGQFLARPHRIRHHGGRGHHRSTGTLNLVVVGPLCPLGHVAVHPGDLPVAAVYLEVLAEAEPLAAHAAAHGVNDKL